MADQPKTTTRRIPPQEISRLGKEIYETKIHEQVYPAHRGKWVAIDVASGKWTMDKYHPRASRRLKDILGDAYVPGNIYAPQVSHPKPKSPTKSYEEIFDRGAEIYDRDIAGRIEPRHNGKFVAIDVDSGEWALSGDCLIAEDRVRDSRPEAVNFLYVTVGFGSRNSRKAVPESPRRSE